MIAIVLPVLLLAAQADDAPARVETLDNGLRIVVIEDHTLPLLSVQLWVAAGSRDDPPEQHGLCQTVRAWFEHRDDAALKLRAAGVRFESATLRDASYFACVAPPGFLEYILQIEARRLRDAQLDAESLTDAVRAVMRTHAILREESDAQPFAAMFPDHPYGHPPRLISRTLIHLTPQVAQSFAARWFVASNATLVVVGDVPAPRVFELARERFAELPWRQRPTRREIDPPPAARIERVLPRDDPGDLVQVAWLTAPLGSFRNAAIDVLMQRLCNDIDGPLSREFAEAGFRTPVFHHDTWRDAGVLTLDVWRKNRSDTARIVTSRPTRDASAQSESNKTAAEATQIVDAALTRASKFPPAEVELNRARALARRSVSERRVSFAQRALRLGRYEVVAGDTLLESYTLPQLAAVTSVDLRHAARGLLTARRVTLDYGGPRRARTADESAPPRGLSPEEAIDRMIAASPHVPLVEPVQAPIVSDMTIAPRLRLIVCHVPGATSVAVRTTIRAEAVWRDLLDPILRAGAVNRDGALIRDYCSYHGIAATSTLTRGRVGLSMIGPRNRWDAMLELNAELIQNPDLEAAVAPGNDTNAVFPHDASLTHPIRRAALQELLEQPQVTIIVVGEITNEEVRTAVEVLWADAVQRRERGEFPVAAESRPAAQSRVIVNDIDSTTRIPRLLVDFTGPEARDSQSRLALEAGFWFLAQPPFDAMRSGDESITWPFSRDHRERFSTTRSATEPFPQQAEWLRDAFRVLTRVRSGAITPPRLRRALHLARVRQLVRLDSVDAIADALQRGVYHPWQIEPALDEAACSDILRASFGDGPILFRAQHLAPALLAVLKEFGDIE